LDRNISALRCLIARIGNFQVVLIDDLPSAMAGADVPLGPSNPGLPSVAGAVPASARSVDAAPKLVLLVALRPTARPRLVRALKTLASDLRLLQRDDVAAVAQAAQGAEPALILLDIASEAIDDPGVARMIDAARSRLPGVPVALLADREAARDIVAAVESGLRGYLPARLEPHLMVEALRLIAAGGTFVPAEPLLASLDAVPAPLEGAAVAGGETAGGRTGPALDGLSQRQLAVLDLLRQGKSNKVIAQELDLPMSTVKVHARQIMRKLGAANRTQVAMKLADRAAWAPP
jgi:DNA-binding NarL/FixJ family response regulator